MDKKALRKKYQAKLNELPKPLYEHYSYLIAQSLFHSKEWKEANTIGITVSRFPEVDTFQIIRKGWEEKKKIVVPKCYPKTKTLRFRVLTAFNELESVYYGLLEPIEAKTKEVENDVIDLLIVPGLLYTKEGYRLGFGGGYYDRFLVNYTGKTLTLAFSQQIVENLPIEEHDRPVRKIITEQGAIECNGI